jgi:hypothetical protein
MAKAKVLDQKAKQKKQKIFIAVGGVLLLGLLAFQVPKMMAMLNQKPPPLPPGAIVQPPNGFPTPPANAPLAAPTLAGSNGTVAAAGAATSNGIVDASAISAAPASGQLVSFGRFASKDPFAQQVDTSASAVAAGTDDGAGPTPPAVPPASPLGPGLGGGGGGTTPAAPVGPVPTSVSIAVNGVPEIVKVDGDFPAANPVFHLVSLTRTSAKMGIAGGSYADGKATVTLKKGKTLTLENTADGSRYALRLLAFDPPPPSPVASTGGTSTGGTSTTAAPASTTALTP